MICDSFVNPQVLVHICDECNYGSNENRCVVCGNVGVTDAYYCRECVQQEKNRDGCPKVVNLGAVRWDNYTNENGFQSTDCLIVMFFCTLKINCCLLFPFFLYDFSDENGFIL